MTYYTPDIVSKLEKPNGKTYTLANEGEKAFTISDKMAAILLDKTATANSPKGRTIINILNNIFKGDTTAIAFGMDLSDEENQYMADQILGILNKHSLTSEDVVASENALKNRTVSGINTITRGVQNQLIAQIAVDEVTKEPKKIAKKSASGQAEKLLTPDNPLAKMVMQVQNGVGKQDVGIGAVSLKAYFAMDTAFNLKIKQVAEELKRSGNTPENVNYVLSELSKIMGNIGWTGHLYDKVMDDGTIRKQLGFDKGCLAGLNFDPLLEALYETGIDEVPAQKGMYGPWVRNGKMSIQQCVRTLKKATSKVDPAQVLSALISLSADNAKDLALAKLNATPELLDIYTYATMTGIPFSAIADVMTSDFFAFATKVGQKNIFDSATYKCDTKGVIPFLLNEKFPSGISAALVASVFSDILQNTPGDKIAEKFFNACKQGDAASIRKGIEHIDEMIRPKKMTAEEREQLERDAEAAEADGIEIFTPQQKDLIVLRNLLEWKIKQIEKNFSESDYDALRKISYILDGVEEMSTLGGALGINQGMKTDLYEFYSFQKRLENFVRKKPGLEHFTLEDFVRNPESYVQAYEKVKVTFNILDVMMSVPHFAAMLRSTATFTGALGSISSRYNISMRLADDLCSKVDQNSLNRNEFKELQFYINDLYIAEFIKQIGQNNDIVLRLPKGSYNYTSYTSAKMVTADNVPLRLNNVLAMGSFKKSMDSAIIPKLIKMMQSDPDLTNNKFLQNLVPFFFEKGKTKKAGWKLTLDMMEIENSPNTDAIYTSILEDFNKIAHKEVFGMPIGDLFFLYNLILNKDSFGRDSLTRIFEDLAANNPTPLVAGFYNMITAMDANAQDVMLGSAEELSDRISRNVPGTKITSKLFEGGQTRSIDFPIDLPETMKMPTVAVDDKAEDGKTKPTAIPVGQFVSSQEAVVALAQLIGRSYRGTTAEAGVECITQDDLDADANSEAPQFGERCREANAFIQNGKVYINIDRCSMESGLHEYAHLIMASMKFNQDDDVRNAYYTLLGKVQQDPRYEEYANAYSDDDSVIGSDLNEEVFCRIFEDFLNNRMVQSSEVAQTLRKSGITQKSLAMLFNLDGENDIKEMAKEIAKNMDADLATLMANFGGAILNLDQVMKTDVVLSQKMNTIKSKLFKSADATNKLTLNCSK